MATNPDPNTVVPDKLAATTLVPASTGRMTIDLTKPVVTSYLFERNAVQGEDGVPLKFAIKESSNDPSKPLPHKFDSGDSVVIYGNDPANKTKIAVGNITNASAGYVDFSIPGEFYMQPGSVNMLMTIASSSGTNQKSIYLRQNVYPNEFASVTVNSQDYLSGLDVLVNAVKAEADSLKSTVDAINASLQNGGYVTTEALQTALSSLKLATATNDGMISSSMFTELTSGSGKHYLQRQVLWSGVAKDVGTKITLSAPVTDYQYIEFTCNDNSAGVAQFMFSPKKTPVSVNKQNVVDNDVYFTAYEAELSQDSTTVYEITHNHRMDVYPGNPAKVLLNPADPLSINEVAGYI